MLKILFSRRTQCHFSIKIRPEREGAISSKTNLYIWTPNVIRPERAARVICSLKKRSIMIKIIKRPDVPDQATSSLMKESTLMKTERRSALPERATSLIMKLSTLMPRAKG